MVSARRGLAMSLVALLVGLVPAAYSDPPDPSWLGGYWDDDDFDTVVAYIASAFATVAQPDVAVQPCLVWIDSIEPARPFSVPPPFRDGTRSRAPPIASRPLC